MYLLKIPGSLIIQMKLSPMIRRWTTTLGLPREMIGQTKCGPIGGHLGIELLLYHLICMLLVLFTDDSFIYDVMSRCYCLRLLIRAMMNQLYYLAPVI